jgi:deoxyuridine 5'-triphosphate nucleotidohydrolase
MIYFNTNPVPTLSIYGKTYTGISMLEALNLILKNPEQYSNLSMHEVEKYFKIIALFHQKNELPKIGFNLKFPDAVRPTKRIIDVGYDLTIINVYKNISDKITMYDTGVAVDIPIGFYAELVPRSSISKTGYMLSNSIGIIDPGYTGTIKVPLIKLDNSLPDIVLPCRIAQLILKPYIVSYDDRVYSIAETTRSSGGFGSTGMI